MSYFFILLLVILLISKKVFSAYLEDCLDKYDCFNCTVIEGCKWENETCINYTEPPEYILAECNSTFYNLTEYNSTEYNLSDCNSSLIEIKEDFYHNLKYLRNTCFPNKVPNKPEEKYIYNELSDKYCGNNFIILNNYRLINGYKIELKNNSGIYGTPNLLCEYVLNHGPLRIDADIFINRTLSQDFSLFYSEDSNYHFHINYSTTLSVCSTDYNSVSFFYFSNKTFETSPFIIYFREYIDFEEESDLLTYLFLAATIGFVVLSIVGIIIVRRCSLYFKLKKNKIRDNNDNINEIKGELSVISEKNIEENSKNEMEYDLQELKPIKGNTIDSFKKNKSSEGTK